MEQNTIYLKKKAVAKLIIFIVLSFCFADVIVTADDPLSNTVSVVPEAEIISGDSFVINVTCSPSDEIKSYEVELSYDPSLFTVSSVSEGDFFNGFDTFFNQGTIDNTGGTISDVYGLIVGPGTVNSPGVLIQLNCAVVSEGNCSVEITDVGLTNNTVYLDVNSVNDTVSIDQSNPTISDESSLISDPIDTDPSYGWVNLSCSANDVQGISSVSLSVICPNDSSFDRSCSEGVSNIWYWNSSAGGLLFSSAGNYSISFFVSDNSGNTNTSQTIYVEIPENWDMNSDHVCDLLDFVAVSNEYEQTGSNGWMREDVDNNGEISVLDLVLLSNDYEEIW